MCTVQSQFLNRCSHNSSICFSLTPDAALAQIAEVVDEVVAHRMPVPVGRKHMKSLPFEARVVFEWRMARHWGFPSELFSTHLYVMTDTCCHIWKLCVLSSFALSLIGHSPHFFVVPALSVPQT